MKVFHLIRLDSMVNIGYVVLHDGYITVRYAACHILLRVIHLAGIKHCSIVPEGAYTRLVG